MLSVRIRLACEGEGCKQAISADGFHWTRPMIRRFARENGWRRTNLRDLCPECAQRELTPGKAVN